MPFEGLTAADRENLPWASLDPVSVHSHSRFSLGIPKQFTRSVDDYIPRNSATKTFTGFKVSEPNHIPSTEVLLLFHEREEYSL